ncbi:hypothetical protein QJS10_CPA06g01091 [Acorus calamus]|uniref:Uncharacterized protein n=1 Tax=Acorus calamus TaxID=4465 RepID=A0AAV9EHF4_ACOCL|nr:hypothetical protein QJS10_CPA06g01091 [Acorus calamus]
MEPQSPKVVSRSGDLQPRGILGLLCGASSSAHLQRDIVNGSSASARRTSLQSFRHIRASSEIAPSLVLLSNNVHPPTLKEGSDAIVDTGGAVCDPKCDSRLMQDIKVLCEITLKRQFSEMSHLVLPRYMLDASSFVSKRLDQTILLHKWNGGSKTSSDELMAHSQFRSATREKLKKVMEWVQQTESVHHGVQTILSNEDCSM